jgi:hypothetical protein
LFNDPTGSGYPSLATLADYGFIPFYSTYKPHVDTAFEYQVTRGTAQSSFNYQFNIPLYGDFWSDMVVHAQIEEVRATTAKFPVQEYRSPVIHTFGTNNVVSQ